MRRARTRALAVLGASALVGSLASPALAHDGENLGTRIAFASEDSTSTGPITHVANLGYKKITATAAENGSDIEFVSTGGKDYAVAGTLRNGLQIVDITTPTAPRLAATYDCPINQGDVQTFRRDGKIYATYTADSAIGAAGAASVCGVAHGLPATWLGTVIVDLTDPENPQPVSAVQIGTGSHNMTVHPSGNFLYNSNSDLVTDTTPQIEIVDITNIAAPVRLADLRIPFNPSSLGSNSHDIAFNAAGTRGYSAALSQTLILDTTDPANPTVLADIENPRINVEHDVKWLELEKADGTMRELLLVGDEIAGAAGNGICPGGGITVFDVTGANATNPVDLGTWFINDVTGTRESAQGEGAGAGGVTRCTSHVFAVYPEQGLLTIGWYQRGVRVLDISGLADYAAPAGVLPVTAIGSGIGITEIASMYFPADSDTWSFKTNKINTDGSFFGYGNDVTRGFDVYRFAGFPSGKTVPAFAVEGASVDGPTPVVPEVGLAVLLPITAALLAGGVVMSRRRRGQLV